MDERQIRLAARSRSGARAEHSRRLPGRQGRLLLAYRVWHRERSCPRRELIDGLWPENPPAAADAALAACCGARRAFGPGCWAGDPSWRFDPGAPVETDVERAAVAVSRAEAAVTRKRFGEAAAAAREALATDLQTFLPDCDGLWSPSAPRVRGAAAARAQALAAAGVGLGGHELGAAEAAAKAAVAAAPFRESAHRALMEVHEAAGNPAEALRAFEHLRVLLRDELGTTPGAAAMAIHQRLLRGEPAPVTAAAPSAVVTWPAPLAIAVERHALVNRGAELAFLESCSAQAAVAPASS